MTGLRNSQEAALRRTLEGLWRDLTERQPTSDDRTLQSIELALPTPAGPLRLASDSYGLPHLLVPVTKGTKDVEDRRSLGVHLTTRTLLTDDEVVRFLDLECRRTALTGVFTGLVADICMVIAGTESAPEQAVPKALEAWRELLGGRPQWTPQQLAGLYGELLVLEHLLAVDPGAADTWTGPTGAAQDFRTHPNAIEVKTTTSAQGRLIRVHGLEQLVRPAAGSLRIVWFRLEAAAPGAADDIPSIVERCLAAGEPHTILSHLDRLGLPALSSSEIRAASFSLIDQRLFEVDEEFPSITPTKFSSGMVPAGVSGIEYFVDLDTVPSLDGDLHQAVRHFLGAR
ncbi:PD-(D/E)XK motif protein [Micromonospora sp. WMMD967]|uniref:PD-(D/E)XK motif protein n=1 Tax=Micromonospora sp. WMMD967 TaxID=3016101 RepID=UPI002417E643|nr:PD-(D/E)XK motif protein [Micromonospora sp. WMMD967]MDG4836940.1 PD-(D/E)XK motif protein [Micromonospora sp. WMMD967]